MPSRLAIPKRFPREKKKFWKAEDGDRELTEAEQREYFAIVPKTSKWRGEVTMETTDTVVGAAERDLTLRAMDPILTVGAVKAGSDAMIRPHRNN